MVTPLGLFTSPDDVHHARPETTMVSPGKMSTLLRSDSAASFDMATVFGVCGVSRCVMLTSFPAFGSGAAGQRQDVKQGARAQHGINSRLLHFAHHRDSLGGIFFGKD